MSAGRRRHGAHRVGLRPAARDARERPRCRDARAGAGLITWPAITAGAAGYLLPGRPGARSRPVSSASSRPVSSASGRPVTRARGRPVTRARGSPVVGTGAYQGTVPTLNPAAVALSVWFVAGPALGLRSATMAAAVGWLLTRRRVARRSRAARDSARTGVLDFARALAAELRAGQLVVPAVAAAAADAGPLAEPIRIAAAQAARGAPLGDVLDQVGARPGAQPLRTIARCLAVTEPTGAGMASTLDEIAVALGDEDRAVSEAAVATALPRASSRLLVGLPLCGLALGAALGRSPIELLRHSPTGHLLLAAGLSLDGVGWWWLRRLNRP